VITLKSGADPLPTILTTGVGYALSIFVDGEVPLQAEWSVWTTSPFAVGTGPTIEFRPVDAATTYINVFVVKKNGLVETASFTAQAIAPQTVPVEVWIIWSELRYNRGEDLHAKIVLRDPRGLGYTSLSWNLYRNSILQASGSDSRIFYPNADHGVYRLTCSVVDFAGNTITGDSAVVITGDFEIQSALKPDPATTMQFLGTVYTGEQRGVGTLSTAVAMPVSALFEEIYLIPGTTHFQIELEDSQADAPAQVVARTPTGNWCVKGLAPGSITLPYEFLDNTHYIPAPADFHLRISTETFASAVGTVNPFNFRLRLKCFYGTKQVFEFKPCDQPVTLGGSGQRARRFTVLFSDVDLIPDADTTLMRVGIVPNTLRRYKTDLPTVLPIPLTVDGQPDSSSLSSRLYYTDQNWVTAYDPADFGLFEVDAHSSYALEETKPFVVSYMMPAYPTIIQRLRRLTGKVAVYMANGYLNAGTVVSVNVLKAGGFSSETVAVNVTASVTSPDLSTYVKIGEATVNITDAEFIDNGLVGFVSVNESASQVGSWPAGTIYPDAGTLGDPIYSASTAPYGRLDGACYYNNGLATVLMGTGISPTGTAFPLTDVVACFDPACGPAGMFCYGDSQGTNSMTVPQPLYSPAPFIAPASQVTHCFCNPCIVTAWIGTLPSYPPFVAYQDNTYCGVAWAFTPCSGTGTPLVVPYPDATTPPDVISYGGTCWGNQGILSDTTGYVLVARGSVAPVFDCQDVTCTGSDPNGMIVRYRDHETNRDADIWFNHLDNGVPHFAVTPQTYDKGDGGLTTGSVSFSAHKQTEEMILVSPGTGELLFTIRPSGHTKQLISYRGGSPMIFDLAAGVEAAVISVIPGDIVTLRLYSSKKVHFSVSWKPFVDYPRLFQTGTLSGTTAIRSIGFTGLTTRSPYQFYGTLPADVTLAEVNPDNILTVTAQGTEYVLIRAQAMSDAPAALPLHSVWYDGTSTLAGPLVFSLYGGRKETGLAGEMDVWINTAGTFPGAFKVSDWKTLVKPGDPPRRSGPIGDVTRNSLRVTNDPPSFYEYPVAYVSSNGDRLVVAGTYRPLTRVIGGTTYGFGGTCPGLAYSVLDV